MKVLRPIAAILLAAGLTAAIAEHFMTSLNVPVALGSRFAVLAGLGLLLLALHSNK